MCIMFTCGLASRPEKETAVLLSHDFNTKGF